MQIKSPVFSTAGSGVGVTVVSPTKVKIIQFNLFEWEPLGLVLYKLTAVAQNKP